MKREKKQLTEVVNFRVPAEMAEAMRKAAANDDRTLSSWVRTHLKSQVQQNQRRPDNREVAA